MKSGKNAPRRIGLLMRPDQMVKRDILRGIAEYGRERGGWELDLLWPLMDLPELPAEVNPDVVIAWGEKKSDLPMLGKLGVPVVMVGHLEAPGAAWVRYDNAGIGRRVAEFLMVKGFPNLAMVCEKLGAIGDYSRERLAGFEGLAGEAGLFRGLFDTREWGQTPEAWAEILPRLGGWLEKLPKPVGIMADTDAGGYHVILACRLSGLRVPEEVAVIGVGGDEMICEFSFPRLSSVELNGIAAGRIAAGLAERVAAGGGAEVVAVPGAEIVERGSSGFHAHRDEVVAKAVRMIANRAQGELRVDEVVREVGISRRSLEKRFKEWAGRGIYEEIQRVRLERAAELLARTDLRLGEIAERCGYVEQRRLSEAFRKRFGMSPRDYRRMRRGEE